MEVDELEEGVWVHELGTGEGKGRDVLHKILVVWVGIQNAASSRVMTCSCIHAAG